MNHVQAGARNVRIVRELSRWKWAIGIVRVGDLNRPLELSVGVRYERCQGASLERRNAECVQRSAEIKVHGLADCPAVTVDRDHRQRVPGALPGKDARYRPAGAVGESYGHPSGHDDRIWVQLLLSPRPRSGAHEPQTA